ncbi:hypothetical protein [Paracoccus sp. (in: a-proteobacteria)]|uniref:hypothetical protein n=1 Tax=Paracoccus sp. TaxID=267 RepID=UPI00396CA18C
MEFFVIGFSIRTVLRVGPYNNLTIKADAWKCRSCGNRCRTGRADGSKIENKNAVKTMGNVPEDAAQQKTLPRLDA